MQAPTRSTMLIFTRTAMFMPTMSATHMFMPTKMLILLSSCGRCRRYCCFYCGCRYIFYFLLHIINKCSCFS